MPKSYSFKSFEEYQDELTAYVRGLLHYRNIPKAFHGLDSDAEAQAVVNAMRALPKFRHDIHLIMTMMDFYKPEEISQKIAKVLDDYLIKALRDEALFEQQALQYQQQCEEQRIAASEHYVSVHETALDELAIEQAALHQDLSAQMAQEANDIARYLKLEAVLQEFHGKTFEDLVEAKNLLLCSRGGSQLTREVSQYSIAAKCEYIALHLTWKAKNGFISLCDEIINHPDISDQEKQIMLKLKGQVVEILQNYRTTPEEKESALKALFADKDFKKSLAACDKGLITKFLDGLLWFITFGIVQSTPSVAQQFNGATKGVFTLYSQLSSAKDGIEIGPAMASDLRPSV